MAVDDREQDDAEREHQRREFVAFERRECVEIVVDRMQRGLRSAQAASGNRTATATACRIV